MIHRIKLMFAMLLACLGVGLGAAAVAQALAFDTARGYAYHVSALDCAAVFPNTCQGPYGPDGLILTNSDGSRVFNYHYYGYYGSRRVICYVQAKVMSSGYSFINTRDCYYT